MLAIISVVVVALVSMLINRFATIALTLTGMSREEARFQARAAMSGVGLTTRRPEDIVSHPVRRRIVFWLMLVGSAGIVTAVASLVLSFRGGTADQRLARAAVLAAALFALWLLLRTRPAERALSRGLGWILRRRGFSTRDFATLLDLSDEYAVAELQIREGDWVAGRRLSELRLRDEGLTILGIERAGGGYVGEARSETEPRPGDNLIIYGPSRAIAKLDRRARGPAGDAEHDRARVRRKPAAAA